ncbi:hypothetical protein LINPERHAP1_LOCUS10742 [Linum perenne]
MVDVDQTRRGRQRDKGVYETRYFPACLSGMIHDFGQKLGDRLRAVLSINYQLSSWRSGSFQELLLYFWWWGTIQGL